VADIRCPNCGKNNPDILDVCQFCQTPLKPESVLRIGQTPTKKNTGELESALPDWLKDMRQQARESAEEDAQAASLSKPQPTEPPDLLAGLASQGGSSDDEDVPDWLASIKPASQPKPAAPSTPEASNDFFTQFNQSEPKPEPAGETPQEEATSWTDLRNESSSKEKDELSDWFAKASEQPQETFDFDADQPQNDMGWTNSLGSTSTSTEKSAPQEEEDLSWLHNLEAASKQTGDLQAPKQGTDWTASFDLPANPPQSSSEQDLSWLDKLGGIDEPAGQTFEQPAAPQNDMSWLDQFGGTSEASQPAQPAAPQEDLSWLNKLGAAAEPSSFDAASDQQMPAEPSASEENLSWLEKPGTPEPLQSFEDSREQPSASGDLNWLNELGATSESSQPGQPAAQEDLNWLNTLGGTSEPLSVPPFSEPSSQAASPRHTAPLGRGDDKEEEPDWLKSAIEPPSMPAPGDLSMDWFTGIEQPADKKSTSVTPPSTPFEGDPFSAPSEPAALSNKDVDSLFSVEMPDWLSNPDPGAAESVSQEANIPPVASDESLAPVDLPSWVQAMRPVEAAISASTPSVADQPVENEGPLAGLQGVIPIAPIGSSRRPKAIPLKLQVSDEQQASAALLEQILGTETSPRALVTATYVAPQQWLRWVLTGLFLVVLSAVIFFRTQAMPVSAGLPVGVSSISNAVMNIPANSKVLVVVDYEPSLAGEMEAISGPLLAQMTQLSHPGFSFIATSPNGAALIERLVSDIDINSAGSPYRNLGYLPGGATGVLGFMENPQRVNAFADVQSFSEYSALVLLSDHAESGRIWVEQLQSQKQVDTTLANKPLLVVASAQAGPLLQPYVLSGQITGMISGISDAAKFETNNSRSGMARTYWDTFGIGLMMSIALIVGGSLWSLFTGLQARRTEAKQG
jgi:hypothetical protein